MEFVVTLAIAGGILYLVIRQSRERDGNAPLRSEIEAGVSFQARLHHASVLGTGDGLPEVWQALAGTGATPAPALVELEQAGNFVSGLGRVRGWRRVALGLGFVVIFPFIPALVLFIARHLR